jgi:hypothetical protein
MSKPFPCCLGELGPDKNVSIIQFKHTCSYFTTSESSASQVSVFFLTPDTSLKSLLSVNNRWLQVARANISGLMPHLATHASHFTHLFWGSVSIIISPPQFVSFMLKQACDICCLTLIMCDVWQATDWSMIKLEKRIKQLIASNLNRNILVLKYWKMTWDDAKIIAKFRQSAWLNGSRVTIGGG